MIEMRGRKPKQESRAREIRARLLVWKQSPESLRPSLRALAAETGVSHQLLSFYLKGLEEWQYKERYRRAKEEAEEIRGRAKAENREMTLRECVHAIVTPGLLDQIERIRQDAKRGPLHRAQFRMLKLLAKQGFPGAQDVLQKCASAGLKKRKHFAEIVKETPRKAGETYVAWVRRIWDQCAKYETTYPAVITEELLQKYSQGIATNREDNLPAIPAGAAKSFRTVEGKVATPQERGEEGAHAFAVRKGISQ
jgi:DNA-binding transcriptional MocR family regulator